MNQDPQQRRQRRQHSKKEPIRKDGSSSDHTMPYGDLPVNEVARGTYGATEDEVSRSNATIAPTFSDTEPGAGPNYGAAGDPYAPNLGGVEDRTTLGPEDVRPTQ